MGLLAKGFGLVQKFAPMIPGAGGLIAKGLAIGSKVLARAPRVVKAGAGLAAGGAAFEAGGALVRPKARRGRVGAGDRYYNGQEFYRRKRRAGLSGRDIQGAQKVARVVKAFGYKPKFQKRRHRR